MATAQQACHRLAGKTVVITASASGIGKAIALRCAQEGANVLVSSRSQDNVDAACADVQRAAAPGADVHGVVCHVGMPEHRERLINTAIQRWGRIDVLVNNAAVNPDFGPIIKTPEKAWNKIFDINVKAAWLLACAVAKTWIARKQTDACIVFVSSVGGHAPLQGLGAYSVSKTALYGLTKALAKELGQYGIRVNGVAPGIVPTKFSAALVSNKRVIKPILASTPLGRLGRPEEIAAIVAFLASTDAAFITGETVFATGGLARM